MAREHNFNMRIDKEVAELVDVAVKESPRATNKSKFTHEALVSELNARKIIDSKKKAEIMKRL